MVIDFVALMNVDKKIDSEARRLTLVQFVESDKDEFLEIANGILSKTLSKRSSYLKRKVTPVKYLEVCLKTAVESWDKTTYCKDLKSGRRRSYEASDLEDTLKQFEVHCRNLAKEFAKCYFDYYLSVDFDTLYSLIPKRLRPSSISYMPYLRRYWELVNPNKYNVHPQSAQEEVMAFILDDLSGERSGMSSDEITQLQVSVVKNIENLNKFYEQSLNIDWSE